MSKNGLFMQLLTAWTSKERAGAGAVRIRRSVRQIAHPASHSVDTAGWQAKMASIELWIQ